MLLSAVFPSPGHPEKECFLDCRGTRSSPNFFDQCLPAERIVPHQQQDAKRCQVVWQFAIGPGAHAADERSDCVSKITAFEIIEGSLLAQRDIPVARHVIYQRAIHFHLPTDDCFEQEQVETQRI